MPQIDIFVISLRRSKERRAHMRNMMDRMGLKFEFIEAVDGSRLVSKELTEITRRSRIEMRRVSSYRQQLLPAEIGCALSHMKAYEEIIERDLDYACILEDDVFVNNSRTMHYFLERDNLQILRTKCDFDYLFLSTTKYETIDRRLRWKKIKMEERIFACKPCNEPLWGTGGYILSKKACEILLEKGRPVRMMSDMLTAQAELFGVRQYVVVPLPLRSNIFESTIESENLRECTEKNIFVFSRLIRFIIKLISLYYIYRNILYFLNKLGIIDFKYTVRKKFPIVDMGRRNRRVERMTLTMINAVWIGKKLGPNPSKRS